MEQTQELEKMLSEALPLLRKFNEWQEVEAQKEKIRQEIESESEREFNAWIEQRKKEQAQQEHDMEQLKKKLM